MKPLTRSSLIGIGLVAVALVWANALYEVHTASEPPNPPPELAPSKLAFEVTHPDFESTHARGEASDGTSVLDLPADYVERETRDRADHQRRRATALASTPDDARSSPELGRVPLTKAPSDSAPKIAHGTEPAGSEISDGALRAAIDRWTGPEQCTAQLPDGPSGTVRVKVGFGLSGEAQALHTLHADGAMARVYVECLQVLLKPFTQEELLASIRAALDAS